MDTALHENQTEFGIFVFTIAFQMLANSDGFLDQVMQIFGFAGSEAFRFHDAQDFAAGDETGLSDTVRITKNNTWRRQSERVRGDEGDLPICDGVKPFFASLQI